MLTRLKISNFLLIDQLELDFNSGLTVITGETGSGKSIIIDALMLIFGARGGVDTIRPGSNQVILEAEFSLTNLVAKEWLQSNDLIDEDDSNNVIFRRIIDKTGKNKIYINGNGVTAGQVRIMGDFLLDVHTQHASISLLKSDMQRGLLDEYTGIGVQVRQLSEYYTKIRQLEQKLKLLVTESRALEIREAILLEQIEDLSNLNLREGEWQELENTHKQLANVGLILQDLDAALSYLNADETNIVSNIKRLNLRLTKLVDMVPKLSETINVLDTIEVELCEVVHNITYVAQSIEQDPTKLAKAEERLEKIFALSRKYKIMPEQITETLSELNEELLTLKTDTNIDAIKAELDAFWQQFKVLAGAVTSRRSVSAVDLGSKVTNLLHKLAINGEFRVILNALDEPCGYGYENIEYQIRFNQGMPLQPLAKIASGGELSRTALALYLLLSIHNPPEVIIFDEIDVGIGGKVAAIVGHMLQGLGLTKQVICITHQPQTASYGDHHLVVSKHDKNGTTIAGVGYVADIDRVQEIARMLGGVNITEATLTHAKEMLSIWVVN